MTALATIADVGNLAGVTITDPAQAARVTALLDVASGIVREATGQQWGAIAGATVTVWPDVDGLLWLPGVPVTAVTSVIVGGVTLNASAYRWTPNGEVVRSWSLWAYLPATIVYSYGTSVVPAAVSYVTAEMVRRVVFGPEPGVRSAAVDDVTVQFSDGAGSGLVLTDELLSMLPKRPTPTSIPVLSDRQYQAWASRQWV